MHEFKGIMYGNGKVVAVTGSGSDKYIVWSSNGTAWTKITRTEDGEFQGAGYGNGYFMAVGIYGDVWVSTDATNSAAWTPKNVAGGFDITFKGVAYGNGTFVVVGSYDKSGSPSNNIIIYSKFPIAPPANLQANVTGSGTYTVDLSWNANTESSVTGYMVYYDSDGDFPYTTSVNANNVLTKQLTNIADNTYLTITAYDASRNGGLSTLVNQQNGNESWFSSQIIIDKSAPTSPTVSINSAAASTASRTVTLSLSTSDVIGVTAYYASESNTAPSSGDNGWVSVSSAKNYSGSGSLTIDSANDGTKTVNVWFSQRYDCS